MPKVVPARFALQPAPHAKVKPFVQAVKPTTIYSTTCAAAVVQSICFPMERPVVSALPTVISVIKLPLSAQSVKLDITCTTICAREPALLLWWFPMIS